jgi:hypothetical protein
VCKRRKERENVIWRMKKGKEYKTKYMNESEREREREREELKRQY